MTSFNDIYCLNATIMNDNRVKRLTTDRVYQLLGLYLAYSIAFFNKWCYKDLTQLTGFDRTEYTFVGDGSTTDFVLSPTPPTGSSFYVGVAGAEEENYTYTEGTSTVSFTIAPPKGEPIYIAAYTIGSFDETLSDEEKVILAQGMVIPFIDYEINKTKALEQVSFPRDFNAFSQANHNKVNLAIDDTRVYNLIHAINEYTYGSFDDNDDLSGLAGDSTR